MIFSVCKRLYVCALLIQFRQEEAHECSSRDFYLLTGKVKGRIVSTHNFNVLLSLNSIGGKSIVSCRLCIFNETNESILFSRRLACW